MAESKAIASVDKQTAHKEALRLARALNDEASIPDVSQVTQDFTQQYTYAARKKILEAMGEHFRKEKGCATSAHLHDFLCAQSADVRGKNLDTLARLLMEVALAAGNDLPCTMLLHLLTTTNPKQPKDYLFTEQSLANVPQDYKMGTPAAEVLLSAWRNKQINPHFLKRWLSALMSLVWTKGRPLLAEEEAALILSVFQELRREDFPTELAIAVPTVVALADKAAAERFMTSSTGKAFSELIPARQGIVQQTSPATGPQASGSGTKTARAEADEQRVQNLKSPDEKKPQVSSVIEGLGLRDRDLVEALMKLLSFHASEEKSLKTKLNTTQQKLQGVEKERDGLYLELSRLNKTMIESKAEWNSDRNALEHQNERTRADIAALEEEKRRMSNEIATLGREIAQTEQQHKAELNNRQHQWTNTLLERVRPHAADVRDHILKLRKDRPQDETIRFLAISYFNVHRELASLMGLDAETECLPRSCLIETQME